MAETMAREQKCREEAIRQLKENADQQANSITVLKEMIAALSLKCNQIVS